MDHGSTNQHHTAHDSHNEHAGHGGHGGHAAQFRHLFLIMSGVGLPVVVFNQAFADLLGCSLPEWSVLPWLVAGLGTVMYFFGGWPFLTGGIGEIRSRKPGMMLLIALAITVAFIASWGVSLGVLDAELNFWWELALLVVIMLLGHWIEMRSLARTTSALDSLAALLPDEAEKVDGEDVVTVAPAELVLGDVVIVRPGAAVPADGTIIAGSASMDEPMVTGESRPATRGTGDQVVAGTVAADYGIRGRVEATGEDTAVAGIRRSGGGDPQYSSLAAS